MEIPVGYAQANLFFTGAAAPTGAQVTLGLELEDSGMSPVDVAEIVGGNWEILILPFQVDDITLDRCVVKFGPNATGPDGEFVISAPGTDSGEPEAPNVAVLVRKVTEDGGRAGRGRMFIPGIKETRVEPGGHINGTYATDLQDNLADYRESLIVSNIPPVVLHGVGAPLSVPSPITQFVVDETAATQRRRLRR